jgi:hypothetical protein
MSQNLIELNLAPETMASVNAALDTLEANLTGLVALDPLQRRSLAKMGDKSEAFCRQAVVAFSQNPSVLPRNFDLDGFLNDLATLDTLRPMLVRVNRLYERLNDTEMAVGSDLMSNALEGYAVLKVAGKGEGLDSMRKALSARFNRRRAGDAPEAPPAG